MDDEKRFEVQAALIELNSALSSLAAQPQQPVYQVAVSEGLDKLNESLKKLIDTYDAVQSKSILSIGAGPYFTMELISGIRNIISENPMTPTIAQQYVERLVEERSVYLENLIAAQSSLEALSINFEL